jgi:DNA-binding MarR family transcriptional regulator
VASRAVDDVGPPGPHPGVFALSLDTTLGHLLRRAQQVHTAIWSEEFSGDLTGPQYALVSAVASTPMLDQRSAGRLASLDKSTAADVVARLQRNGWIACESHPADRRRKTLALTAVARAALREVTPKAQRVQNRLLTPLGPANQRALIRLLGAIAFRGAPTPKDIPRTGPPVLALSTTPGHLIRRAEQEHGAAWAQHTGRTMTPSQYALLCALAWNPAIDQTAAGELASLDKSSAADIVSRLTRRGWIMTEPDPSDRRRKLLRLAAEAVAVLTETTPKVGHVQHDLVEHLTATDADRLTRLLRRVAYRAG